MSFVVLQALEEYMNALVHESLYENVMMERFHL